MNELFFGAALIISLVLMGIGIVIGLIGCMVLALLVLAGVMTSSTLFGVLRGKIGSGLRAFWYQCSLLGGIPAGLICVFATQFLFAPWERGAVPWFAGALGGMAGALILTLMLDFLVRKTAGWLGSRS